MINDDSNTIPYRSRIIKVKCKPSLIRKPVGVQRSSDKFLWQTNDTIKPFEEGLPLITGSAFGKPFVDPNEVEKSINQRRKDIIKEFYPDGTNKNNRSEKYRSSINSSEKETQSNNKICGRTTNKGAKRPKSPKTGILFVPLQEDTIDCIGRIYLKSVDGTEPIEVGENPFPPCSRKIPRNTLPPKNVSQIVQDEIHRVFKPGSESFSGTDYENDFPLNGFYPSSTSDDSDLIVEEEDIPDIFEDGVDTSTIFLDPHEKDIFFTKEKVPFTKNEAEMLKKWRLQNQQNNLLIGKKEKEMMKERSMCMSRTFQSRLAFDKQLELTEQLCERVKYLQPGKGENRKQMSWKISSKFANHDPSSLPFRKRVWEKFRQMVKFVGYVQTPTQDKLVTMFRDHLLAGHTVGPEMFFNILDKLENDEFINLKHALFIEFMRDSIGVTCEDLHKYIHDRNACDMFVKDAPEEIKRIKKRKERTKLKIKKEQEERLLRAGMFSIPDIEQGMKIFRPPQ